MFEPMGVDAPQYTGENTANTFSRCRLLSPMAQKASTKSSVTNGNADRLDIVWAVENGSAGVLRAYDPADLAHEYYHSAQSTERFAGPSEIAQLRAARGATWENTRRI